MTKLTISRERFEKMKGVLAVLVPTSREQQHCIVTSQLEAAGMEVEKTAEERVEELEARLKKLEERDAAFVAAFRAWPGSREIYHTLCGLIYERFPEARDG